MTVVEEAKGLVDGITSLDDSGGRNRGEGGPRAGGFILPRAQRAT